MSDLTKQYEQSLHFWNDWYAKLDGEKIDSAESGSAELDEKFALLAKGGLILDAGCGAGWAALRIAYAGAKVIGFDCSQSAIEVAEKGKVCSKIDNVHFVLQDDKYLDDIADCTYDGAFSSNLLDVIPTEVAERIMSKIHRTLKKDAQFIVMLNPYMDWALYEKGGFEKIDEDVYGKDGNLRCVNKSREQWQQLFEKYFTVTQYQEFQFQGENLTSLRRLFTLTK